MGTAWDVRHCRWGTAGTIRFIRVSSKHIQARAKFRDFDGRVRLVSKNGRAAPQPNAP
jgi:hypothetical protein